MVILAVVNTLKIPNFKKQIKIARDYATNYVIFMGFVEINHLNLPIQNGFNRFTID
ncbi:hypothetical protein GLIP_0299 [Aliiglaciecola lipolytica E3]|uniref:Uncharacterized protein n=1 Tax=Aliiglaciecola lipolytica E3 TaxID=1127673 RepID=K6WWX7_9ALTE|nr:hypothetical protein GLIP_0299 [Aliiglaciecola lipolytica E3]